MTFLIVVWVVLTIANTARGLAFIQKNRSLKEKVRILESEKAALEKKAQRLQAQLYGEITK